MEKRGYLAVFILILIGLFMGFSIAAQFSATKPWHPLQQVTTTSAGTASVDSNDNGRIDRVDSIGENIVYPNSQLMNTAGVAYNTWTLLPAGVPAVVPASADFVILKYAMVTTGNTQQQCPGITIEFTGATNAAQAAGNQIIQLATTDMGAFMTEDTGQVIVPIRKNAQGVSQLDFYFRYLYAVGNVGARLPNNPNIAQPCVYTLYYQGYIE